MAPHVPVAALLAFIAHAALVHARTSVPAAAPAPRAAPQQLISLSTLFAAEAPPACIRDTPSSRWAVVAAAKDRSKPTVFCYGSRAQKCYRRATCCAWYKNQQECLAALPEARDNREGTYKEQLQCGKQLCAANGKSGFGERLRAASDVVLQSLVMQRVRLTSTCEACMFV